MGKVFVGLGVFFIVLAVGLTVWNIATQTPVWVNLINLFTFGCGILIIRNGLAVIKSEREIKRVLARLGR